MSTTVIGPIESDDLIKTNAERETELGKSMLAARHDIYIPRLVLKTIAGILMLDEFYWK